MKWFHQQQHAAIPEEILPRTTQITPRLSAGKPLKAGQDGYAEQVLETSLCSFGGNAWTVRDAVQGVQIFGGNGSGKTSGSGATLARAFILHGFGGLVLTAKPDDVEAWLGYFRDVGMSPDEVRNRVVVVAPDRPSCGNESEEGPLPVTHVNAFNFLAYEYLNNGRLTGDIVSLFVTAMSSNSSQNSRADPFWEEAMRELLLHAVDLAAFYSDTEEGSGHLKLSDILKIIQTAPQTVAEAKSASWRGDDGGLCWRALSAVSATIEAGAGPRAGRLADFSRTLDYWTESFPALSDKTRSIVVSSLTAKASTLLHSPIRELLCGDDDPKVCAARPETTFDGKIVILNLPVKIYGEVGRFAQTLWKTVWQRAVERRGTSWQRTAQRPVFIWADEAQYFVTREDALFQQTARSSLAATVYLTQSISNYHASMSSDFARAGTDSLIGNLQTKIFHANGDPATNEWAGRLFGRILRDLPTRSITRSEKNDSSGRSVARSTLPVLEAQHFAALKTGGPAANYEVEAWVFKAGKPWAHSENTARALGYSEVPPHILHCTFSQKVTHHATDQAITKQD